MNRAPPHRPARVAPVAQCAPATRLNSRSPASQTRQRCVSPDENSACVLYFAAKSLGGEAMFYGSFPYWPQMTAAVGIAIGGIVGSAAALDTGEVDRYLGTALFLVITVSLYIWKFHLAAKR